MADTDDRRYSHKPLSRWPEQWKQPRPERTYPVHLSCGCVRRFAAPVPAVGSSLGCPTHHENIRVVAGDDER